MTYNLFVPSSCVCPDRLWGNPSHLKYLETSIQEAYPELHVLVAKSNADSFTYDGIDVGGERTANEIEQRLKELEEEGHNIKKISIVGYSLGGLVARYAIGLLYTNKIFDKIQPVVCMETPHISLRRSLEIELYHLRDPTSGRKDSHEWRSILYVERVRRPYPQYFRSPALHRRQVSRYWPTSACNHGRTSKHLPACPEIV